jgi:hypothetical protein
MKGRAANLAFRNWLKQNYGRPVGAKVDWSNISPRAIKELSEEMFDAAGTPAGARQSYYSALTKYLYGVAGGV